MICDCVDDTGPREGDVESEAGRDGLSHIFLATDGSPVPNQLATIGPKFWVMEVPKNYMASVTKAVYALEFSIIRFHYILAHYFVLYSK